MIKSILSFFVLLFLCSCTFSGSMMRVKDAGTTIDLSKKNYRVVKSAAQGTDRGFYLLGLIPIAQATYNEAIRDLYSNVNVKNRAAALINVTQERTYFYIILWSVPQLTVTADVIEFVDENKPAQ